MRWLTRTLTLTLALALGLTAYLPETAAAPSTAKKKKSTSHVIRGTVVAVHHDKNKDHGTIKVRTAQHHKKKTTTTTATTAAKKKHHSHVVTVKVHSNTHFEKVIHQRGGQTQNASASFKDVHKGEHVHVLVKGKKHDAKNVEIVMNLHNRKPGTKTGIASRQTGTKNTARPTSKTKPTARPKAKNK